MGHDRMLEPCYDLSEASGVVLEGGLLINMIYLGRQSTRHVIDIMN